MQLIVCALISEAKPLVARFGLKKDFTVKEHELFSGAEAELIVSGVGKVRCAIATTALLLRHVQRSSLCIANIGICGSALRHSVGELLMINKITDSSSGKSYYPDMLLRHELSEASLVTYEHPITREMPLQNATQLVDMEASGFIQAAQTFLFPHQIQCLKIVSDQLEGQRLEPETVSCLVKAKTEEIARVLSLHQEFTARQNDRRACA